MTPRYADVVTPEMVERCVDDSFTELAIGARVGTFLPVLTERVAAERLDSLAQRRKRP